MINIRRKAFENPPVVSRIGYLLNFFKIKQAKYLLKFFFALTSSLQNIHPAIPPFKVLPKIYH
jgi:hypothetical protein